ncbi:putative MFS family arabinose efflux permease [Bacillus mesophilus]|uniref:MFS transporter n=1 Tax=Bacillus mesophilus TaxID=1808955 RepID=A0A6M0QDV0_9BACI|nr:MFS transporter [Bacillus mesophilus]MBM7662594.1 putative MFS family arabinose efflux permease [Bacillus mesophilus]NEY73338.1 MFS transporter [Bacillus mesophilus]
MNNQNKKEQFPLFVTFILISGIFLVGSDELILSPLLPELVRDLNTTFSLASLSVSLYGLAIGLVVPFIAPFIDRVSRARLMGVSLLIFSVTSFLCAIAPNMLILLIGRLLSGICAGIYIPTAYAFVGDQVPFKFRGRVMGIVLSGWSLSLILGIPLGAYIGDLYHWRWTFILIGLLSIIISTLSLTLLKTEQSAEYHHQKQNGFFQHLFIALNEKQVTLLLFTTFCNMFGFYGVYTFLGSYVQQAYQLNVSESGKVILFYGIGIALSPLAGVIVDFFGKKAALITALIGLSVTLFALSSVKVPLLIFYILLVVWGALQSVVLTSISSLLSNQSTELRGRIMSLYSLSTNLAVATGSFIMGMFYSSFGFHIVGIICGIITGLGGVVYTLSLIKLKKKVELTAIEKY